MRGRRRGMEWRNGRKLTAPQTFSRHCGEQQEHAEDDEVHGALQDGRPPGRQRERTHEQGEQQDRRAFGVEAERQLPPEIERDAGDDRNGEADAGERRADREVEAGLEAVGVRRLHRRDALGQQDQRCDDDAEKRRRQAGGVDRALDRLRQRLGEQHHRKQADEQHDGAERRLATRRRGRLVADVAHLLGHKIVAVPHRLDEHEHEIEEQRQPADEDELGRRILRPELGQGEIRHDERQHRERSEHAERGRGALDPETLLAIARASDQQAEADHAVQHDRHRREHRVAGERVFAPAARREHGGHDQRGLDHRDGEGEQHRAERLADLQRDHLGVMDRREHRAEQQEAGERRHPGRLGGEDVLMLEREQSQRRQRRRDRPARGRRNSRASRTCVVPLERDAEVAPKSSSCASALSAGIFPRGERDVPFPVGRGKPRSGRVVVTS